MKGKKDIKEQVEALQSQAKNRLKNWLMKVA